MGATIIVNGQTVVHKDSGGTVTTTDVCKTPMGSAVVPIPYVNVARSADVANGSATVTMDDNPIMLKDSVFSRSSGDEAGSLGGVASGVTGGKAKFVNFSSNVFVEGRPVCRRLDLMVSNLAGTGNTPPAPLVQANIGTGKSDSEMHYISFALLFDAPDVIHGRVETPLFASGHTMRGAQEHRHDGGNHCGAVYASAAPGTYELQFDKFDLQPAPLTRKEKP